MHTFKSEIATSSCLSRHATQQVCQQRLNDSLRCDEKAFLRRVSALFEFEANLTNTTSFGGMEGWTGGASNVHGRLAAPYFDGSV